MTADRTAWRKIRCAAGTSNVGNDDLCVSACTKGVGGDDKCTGCDDFPLVVLLPTHIVNYIMVDTVYPY